jgi:hypothetical protein
METLRRLWASNGPNPGDDTLKSTPQPVLTIHIPSYGSIHMPNPNHSASLEGIGHEDARGTTHPLHGELEVSISQAIGAQKCKSIRVGVRGSVALDMGTPRGWEEDELYRSEIELVGNKNQLLQPEEVEGEVWLPVGTKRCVLYPFAVFARWSGLNLYRFPFTLNLPSTLPPHDHHPRGKIWYRVYAEMETYSGTSSRSISDTTAADQESSHKSRISVQHGREDHAAPISLKSSRTVKKPAPGAVPDANTNKTTDYAKIHHHDITRTESSVIGGRAPAYKLGEKTSPPVGEHVSRQARDLAGDISTVGTERIVIFVYNPNPRGGITTLEDRSAGNAPGVGVYRLEMLSDVVSAARCFGYRFANLPVAQYLRYRALHHHTLCPFAQNCRLPIPPFARPGYGTRIAARWEGIPDKSIVHLCYQGCSTTQSAVSIFPGSDPEHLGRPGCTGRDELGR